MQEPFDIWMHTLQANQRNTDVEWRNTIMAEMQKDAALQHAEEENLRKTFEESMSRSEALASMQIQKIIALAPSDPSSDNIPDRCKCFVEIRGEWLRPASIDPNDPKLWSKLASALVRDTLDSTLVVISTDPRRTAKAAGGRKVEMYCRCAGKNKAKEGKRKARQLKPPAPPATMVGPADGIPEAHAAMYGTSLFEPSNFAHTHSLVIDATGQQNLLPQEAPHVHRQPAQDAVLMQHARMMPDSLTLEQTQGDMENESLGMDEARESDKLAEDERESVLMQKCLARAILLLDVSDDRSSGTFVLKVHMMHTHRCKHIVVGHARKEIDHSRTFMDTMISVFDNVSKALRKRQPDGDIVEATRRLRSRICLPRGPLNQTKLVYFLRQFTDAEFLKHMPGQTRMLGMPGDGMQQIGDPNDQNRRRKRSNSNLYQDGFADMYGQDTRRVRSNSASSGGMLTGQLHPQMGMLTGAPDGSAGPISDTLLDEQHLQTYHLPHQQIEREVQDPQAAWVWTLMNSPQVQGSGQAVPPVIEALRRGQGNPHQLNMLSSLIQNQGLEDLQHAVADSLKNVAQQYTGEGIQDVNQGWVQSYPAQHGRVDDRQENVDDQRQQLPKNQNGDGDIIEATPV